MFTEGSRTHAFVSAVSSAIIHSTIAATCESTESMAGRGEVSGGTTRPISVHECVTASTPHQLTTTQAPCPAMRRCPEAGAIAARPNPRALSDTFRQIAETNRLDFTVETDQIATCEPESGCAPMTSPW